MDVDRDLVEKVRKLYSLPSAAAATDLALRSLLPSDDRRDILDLEGIGWDGDLNKIRSRN